MDSISWLIEILTLIAAVSAVFLSAYIKKKAENLASREDFEEALSQLRQSTEAVEAVKAQFTHGVEELRHQLESNRVFAAFQREQTMHYLERFLDSYVDWRTFLGLFNRQNWLDAQSLPDLEKSFFSNVFAMRVGLSLLKALSAISTDRHRAVAQKIADIHYSWDDFYATLSDLRKVKKTWSRELADEAIKTQKRLNEMDVLVAELLSDLKLPEVGP